MLRRGLIIAAIAAALGAGAASSVIYAQTNNPPGNPPPVKIPPSEAAAQAVQMNPGSTVIGVKDAGNHYVVTLKAPGKVKRVNIPSTP
jgi:hypothetical protein